MNLLAFLREEQRKLTTRVKLLIARAAVRAINDAGGVQLAQIEPSAGEVHDDVEHFQSYGFKSVPPAGSHAIVIFPNGAREHGLVLTIHKPAVRPAGWAAGEVGLFTDEGPALHLKRNRIAELTQDELVITVDSLTIDAGGSTLEMDATGVTITTPAFKVVSPSVDFDPA